MPLSSLLTVDFDGILILASHALAVTYPLMQPSRMIALSSGSACLACESVRSDTHCWTARAVTWSSGMSPHSGSTLTRIALTCWANVCGDLSPRSTSSSITGFTHCCHVCPTVGHGASVECSRRRLARAS